MLIVMKLLWYKASSSYLFYVFPASLAVNRDLPNVQNLQDRELLNAMKATAECAEEGKEKNSSDCDLAVLDPARLDKLADVWLHLRDGWGFTSRMCFFRFPGFTVNNNNNIAKGREGERYSLSKRLMQKQTCLIFYVQKEQETKKASGGV